MLNDVTKQTTARSTTKLLRKFALNGASYSCQFPLNGEVGTAKTQCNPKLTLP
jgi:hypothetical protein